MPGQWYGRAPELARTRMPELPSGWNDNPANSQYVQENPADFNAWVLQQPGYTQQDLGQQFYGWLQTWLGGRPTAFGGYKIANPEAKYEDYLLGQNPWLDYQQQNRPAAQAATFFGPRLQQR